MKIDVTLDDKKALLVYGPARIEIISGRASIYGKEIQDIVDVKQYKAVPIETDKKAEISIEYTVKKPEFKDRERIGTRIWRNEVYRFLRRYGDILILGDTDSGKSSLTVYLTNEAIDMGVAPGVADFDPGQGDIGIPSFIGGGIVKKKIFTLEEVKEEVCGFVGSTTPMGFEDALIKEAEKIYKGISQKVDFVIMNYHGWVRGVNAFKNIIDFIDVLKIDNVLIIGNDKLRRDFILVNEIYNKNINVYFVKKPETTIRSRVARKMIREEKYRMFIERSRFKEYTFDLKSILERVHGQVNIPMDSRLVKQILKEDFGIEKEPDFLFVIKGLVKIYYYSDTVDKVIYRTFLGDIDIPMDIFLLPRSFIGLLTGIKYKDTWIPSLLKKIDFRRLRLHVLVPSDKIEEEVNELKIGRVLVDLTGREKGFLKKDLL